MTFEVYFKVSKEDNLVDIVRLSNVGKIVPNRNGKMIFFYDFDKHEIARFHTDYICNIVPTLPVIVCDPPVKTPAESVDDAAYNALVRRCADIVPPPPAKTPAESVEALAEAMKTKGGSTGNYNQTTDGRNMIGDPVDF